MGDSADMMFDEAMRQEAENPYDGAVSRRKTAIKLHERLFNNSEKKQKLFPDVYKAELAEIESALLTEYDTGRND